MRQMLIMVLVVVSLLTISYQGAALDRHENRDFTEQQNGFSWGVRNGTILWYHLQAISSSLEPEPVDVNFFLEIEDLPSIPDTIDTVVGAGPSQGLTRFGDGVDLLSYFVLQGFLLAPIAPVIAVPSLAEHWDNYTTAIETLDPAWGVEVVDDTTFWGYGLSYNISSVIDVHTSTRWAKSDGTLQRTELHLSAHNLTADVTLQKTDATTALVDDVIDFGGLGVTIVALPMVAVSLYNRRKQSLQDEDIQQEPIGSAHTTILTRLGAFSIPIGVALAILNVNMIVRRPYTQEELTWDYIYHFYSHDIVQLGLYLQVIWLAILTVAFFGAFLIGRDSLSVGSTTSLFLMTWNTVTIVGVWNSLGESTSFISGWHELTVHVALTMILVSITLVQGRGFGKSKGTAALQGFLAILVIVIAEVWILLEETLYVWIPWGVFFVCLGSVISGVTLWSYGRPRRSSGVL